MLALFVRRTRVLMLVLQPLVAAVPQATGALLERQRTGLEQGEVVQFPRTKSRCQNPLGGLVNHDLRFVRVPLFLAAVVALLLFLGRCSGTCVASTITTSKANRGSCNAFLPGKANLPEAINLASTWRMVRQTVGSETP